MIAPAAWQPLDLMHCMTTQPPAIDFVLPGLAAGTVGGLVSPGGVGKSTASLEMMVYITTGLDLFGWGGIPGGRAMLMAAEDPVPVLHGRIAALASRMGEDERGYFAELAEIYPTYGQGGDLLDGGATAGRITELGRGKRLIIIDTLSRWHSGDENDRADAARVMRTLEKIAKETGAAVVFLHHTSKAAALNGQGDIQQAGRGSSVFVDESRWVAFMQTCTEDEAQTLGIVSDERKSYVRYGLSKANYIASPPDIWVRREAGGVLVRHEMPQAQAKQGKKGAKHEIDPWTDPWTL